MIAPLQLYQRRIRAAMKAHWHKLKHLLMITFLVSLVACQAPQATAEVISISIIHDGTLTDVHIPAGNTVNDVLSQAGIELGRLDQVEPAVYTVLKNGTVITVTRVTETYELETHILPYKQQVIHNDTLPAGESVLLQAGLNGTEEITYRIVYEENRELSRSITKRIVLLPPRPEISMIGSQPIYSTVRLPGLLAYINAGNAWIISENSSSRQALVMTGDLDGRVFQLSPDRKWLLFSRTDNSEQIINSLWLQRVDAPAQDSIALPIDNVIHFAGWSPIVDSFNRYQIAYSTVEPRASAPGWQADNNFNILTLSSNGLILKSDVILEANLGDLYGWWGTDFLWAPDGSKLAVIRTGSIGLLEPTTGSITTLLTFAPFETGGNWAWLPAISWHESSRILYVVIPESTPESIAAANVQFNLTAIDTLTGSSVVVTEDLGVLSSLSSADRAFQQIAGFQPLAYLKAFDSPANISARYHLSILDWDGSDNRRIFPPPGEAGLDPSMLCYSPDGNFIAFLYRSDLWIYHFATETSRNLTTSGQITMFDWIP